MAGSLRQKPGNSAIMRAWHDYAHCPFRLFTPVGLTHTLILFSLVMLKVIPVQPLMLNNLLFISLFGLLATPVLGALLFWMPLRFNQSAIGYGWYSFASLLILISLAIMEAGLFNGPKWIGTGALVALLAWYMALQSLKSVSIRVNSCDRPWYATVLFGLYSIWVGIMVFGAGSYLHSALMTRAIPFSLLMLGVIAILPGIIVLQRRKPVTKMSCSIK